MLSVIVISLSLWWQNRDLLPKTISLAAGVQGGQYFELASYLQKHLSKITRRKVSVIETLGSQQNLELLLSKKVALPDLPW